MNVASLREQSGISVVELMVVMLIFGVVGMGLATTAISITRATSKVDAMTTDQGSGRNAMAVIGRDLRAAVPVRRTEEPAFRVARGDEVEFTALLDSSTRPQLVRLHVDDQNRLIEDVTPSNGGTLETGTLAYDPTQTTVRNVTTYVVNGPDEPIFTFHAGADVLTPTSTPQGRRLSDSDRARVTSVTVRLYLSSDPSGRTGRYEIENRVRLPNVQYVAEEAS